MQTSEFREGLEGVIETAYAAGYEPTLWTDMVARYARLMRSDKAGLHAPPEPGKPGRIFVNHGVDITPVLDKAAIYGLQAPIGDRAIATGAAPGAFIQSEVFPDAEYRATDYYREFAHPTGVDQTLQTILLVAGVETTNRVSLTVGRSLHQPSYGLTELATARALFPHLRRAIRLALKVMPERALDPAVADALDGFDTPCCLLGVDGRLVHANAAAREMLDDGRALQRTNRGIRGSDPRAQADLAQAIVSACNDDLQWSRRGVAEVVLPRADAHPVVAVVMPLGPNNPLMHAGPLRAAVYLLDVETHRRSISELGRIRDLFALTQAEAEVTAGLLRGHTATQIAEERGVSLHTVRTQIKLILEKTQSTNQIDLVRLHKLFAVRG